MAQTIPCQHLACLVTVSTGREYGVVEPRGVVYLRPCQEHSCYILLLPTAEIQDILLYVYTPSRYNKTINNIQDANTVDSEIFAGSLFHNFFIFQLFVSS